MLLHFYNRLYRQPLRHYLITLGAMYASDTITPTITSVIQNKLIMSAAKFLFILIVTVVLTHSGHVHAQTQEQTRLIMLSASPTSAVAGEAIRVCTEILFPTPATEATVFFSLQNTDTQGGLITIGNSTLTAVPAGNRRVCINYTSPINFPAATYSVAIDVSINKGSLNRILGKNLIIGYQNRQTNTQTPQAIAAQNIPTTTSVTKDNKLTTTETTPRQSNQPNVSLLKLSSSKNSFVNGNSIRLCSELRFSETVATATVRFSLQDIDSPGITVKVGETTLKSISKKDYRSCVNFVASKDLLAQKYAVVIDVSTTGNPFSRITGRELIMTGPGQAVPVSSATVSPIATTTPTSGTTTTQGALGMPMKVTFFDDFTTFNRDIWSTGLHHHGVSNAGERQWYDPQNISIQPGGILRINASEKTFDGKTISSGAIHSAEGFTQRYGRFEMRAKLPAGAGTWSAFWLMPNDNSWPPEIDIFEYLGRYPKELYQSHHFWVTENVRRSYKTNTVKLGALNVSSDFHTYAVDWRPGILIFSVDGKETSRITENVTDKPMFMIANLAFGGSWAGKVDHKALPTYMDIDYIRVSQYDDLAKIPTPERVLQLGKSKANKREFKAGESIELSTSIRAGVQDLGRTTVRLKLTSLQDNLTSFGKEAWIKVPELKKGVTYPVKLTYAIPKDIKEGYYTLTVNAGLDNPSSAPVDPITKKAISQVWRGTADQILIKQ